MQKGLIVFKNLYSDEFLSTQVGFDNFYKLEDLLDFISSTKYIELCEGQYEYATKIPGVHNHYLDNLIYLREIGLPSNILLRMRFISSDCQNCSMVEFSTSYPLPGSMSSCVGVQLQHGQYSPRTGLPEAVTIIWVHAYTQNDLLSMFTE